MADLLIPPGSAAPSPAPSPGRSLWCDAGLAGVSLPAGSGGLGNPPFDLLLKESLVAEDHTPLPESAEPEDERQDALLGVLGPAATVLPPQLVSRLLATSTAAAPEPARSRPDAGPSTDPSAGTTGSPTALLDAYLARRVLAPHPGAERSPVASAAPAGAAGATHPATDTVWTPAVPRAAAKPEPSAAVPGPFEAAAEPMPAIAPDLEGELPEFNTSATIRVTENGVTAERESPAAGRSRPELQQPLPITWTTHVSDIAPVAESPALTVPDLPLTFDPSTQSFVASAGSFERQHGALSQPAPSVRPFELGRGSWAVSSGGSPVGAADGPRPHEGGPPILLDGVYPRAGRQIDAGLPNVADDRVAAEPSTITRVAEAEPLSSGPSAAGVSVDASGFETGVTAATATPTEQASAPVQPAAAGVVHSSIEAVFPSAPQPDTGPGPVESLPEQATAVPHADQSTADARRPVQQARAFDVTAGADRVVAGAGTPAGDAEHDTTAMPATTAYTDRTLPPMAADQETVEPAPAATATIDAPLTTASPAPSASRPVIESGADGPAATTHRAEQSLPTAPVPTAGAVSGTGPVDQVAGALALSIREGRTEVTIHLRPNNLGAVNVRIVAGEDGLVIHLAAERDEAGDILRSQIGELRQALINHQVPVAELHVLHNPPAAPAASEQRQSPPEDRTAPDRDEPQQDRRRPHDRDEDTE